MPYPRDVALDEVRLAIFGASGDGTAYGFTRSAVTEVPAPDALLLLGTGLAGIARRER